MDVKVCHNTTVWNADGIGRDRIGTDYQPGDLLVVVCETTTAHEGLGDLTPTEVCEWIFRLFNMDPDMMDQHSRKVAEAYHKAGNRSLSVGDVVIVDEVPFACGACNWQPVDSADVVIIERTLAGTNPDWRVLA